MYFLSHPIDCCTNYNFDFKCVVVKNSIMKMSKVADVILFLTTINEERKYMRNVREIVERLEITIFTNLDHIEKIENSKKLTKWMMHKLGENQKKFLVIKCRRHYLNKNDRSLDRTVMCDKKWVLRDNQK
ncbi:hypothetical protein ANCDUO_07484 [Ancylostoma duodenale]|uniref:Uncharacterized protein n=1 Tax=Ancylostoma duodenale TaxID=51022 RepID=A0A0C2GTB1_9BILA|nr:hypothetical protein ANCDUO_07484 [Ancylostoma duodenale]